MAVDPVVGHDALGLLDPLSSHSLTCARFARDEETRGTPRQTHRLRERAITVLVTRRVGIDAILTAMENRQFEHGHELAR